MLFGVAGSQVDLEVILSEGGWEWGLTDACLWGLVILKCSVDVAVSNVMSKTRVFRIACLAGRENKCFCFDISFIVGEIGLCVLFICYSDIRS